MADSPSYNIFGRSFHMIKVKTGQKAPVSGQYKESGSKTEVTFVEGNRVPPTKNGATTFTLVDKTVHKKG